MCLLLKVFPEVLSLGIYQLERSASHYDLLLYYPNIKMLYRFLTTNFSLLLNHRERESRAILPAALITTSKWPYSFPPHFLLH